MRLLSALLVSVLWASPVTAEEASMCYLPQPSPGPSVQLPCSPVVPEVATVAHAAEKQGRDSGIGSDRKLNLFFAGVVAFFTVGLYFATRKTARIAAAALTESRSANEVASEAAHAATAGAAAAKLSADAMIAAERAWVFFHAVRFSCDEFSVSGETFYKVKVFLDLKNLGHTPAIIRMISAELSVVGVSEEFHPARPMEHPDLSIEEALAPEVVRIGNDDNLGAEETVLSLSDWKNVRNYKKGLFLVAVVDYRDVFSVPRRTMVCFAYDPSNEKFVGSGKLNSVLT